MRKVAGNILVLAMAVTYALLAVQAEPITATIGWIFTVLLTGAVIVNTTKKEQ